MKIAIVGYGKMGKLIEQLAPQYSAEVVLKLDEFNNANYEGLTKENFNGVDVAIEGDDLVVNGRGQVPGGGVVATHMDHRLAMSGLMMGLASEQPVGVDDMGFVATSFPGFADMMRGLGADLS